MKYFACLLCAALCILAVEGLSQDGTLDPAFGNGGIALSDPTPENDQGDAIALDPNGRIIVGGVVGGVSYSWGLLAFAPDGTPDANFGNNGQVVLSFAGTDMVTDLAMQSDGRILATGHGNSSFRAARFLPDGSLDSNFAENGVAEIQFPLGGEISTSLATQPDGSVILVGNVDAPNGHDPAMCRLLPDESLDPSFGNAGLIYDHAPGMSTTQYTCWPTDVLTGPDGFILMCGYTSTWPLSASNMFVSRYDAEGLPDSGFGTEGSVTFNISLFEEVAASIALLPDGKLLVAGYLDQEGTLDAFLLRLNTDGSIDETFGTGGMVQFALPGNDDKWFTVRVLPDGRITTTGTSGIHDTDYPYPQKPLIARYLPDGSLDPTFGNGGYAIIDQAGHHGPGWNSAIQADGNIVLAGTYWGEANNSQIAVYRVLISPLNAIAEDRVDVPRIYPNPATDHLHLIWPESLGQAQRVDITDAAGRVVFTRQLSGGLASPLSQPVANLVTGSYTVRVTGDRSIACAKFIKY